MKPTLILAAALFLLSAPPPDAGDIAEMTANFIVLESVPGSLNAYEAPIVQNATSRHSSTPVAARNEPHDESRQAAAPENGQHYEPVL